MSTFFLAYSTAKLWESHNLSKYLGPVFADQNRAIVVVKQRLAILFGVPSYPMQEMGRH